MNILKLATKETNIKELAPALGKSAKQVYKIIDGGVKQTALDEIKVWMNWTDNDTIIKDLCESQFGYFVREIPRASNQDFTAVGEMIKEFGEFITAFSEAHLDGKVTRAEFIKIKQEWSDCVGKAHGMFMGIEKELSK